MNETDSGAELVDRLAEEFLTRFRRGERPAVQEYTAKYPEHAAQIRDLFPALVLLEQAAPASDSEPADAPACLPEQLGDYRIVREIGRGGMGVVYEAEQQSLGRRVALKVLLGHAARDAKVLARFRRESRSAAQLHHTNIVPVYEVGQQDGLCYYAMQFIRGPALDQVVRELQHLRADQEGAASAEPVAHSLWTGAFEPAGGDSGAVSRPSEKSPAALPDRSELSSVASNYVRYCRNVARLGLQAAEALAHAHGRGIVHRDVKPANLLLDPAGVLWVSDFGLVKTQEQALTETGDLVGTLRYMAPERFRGECDARADVYALGLTLYELLLLRPAFDGTDRLRLVEQIGRQEPARPRTLDPRIPRDLETILMKAIEKDPRRRYPSADDMAEDLRRYLADEPIRARRIGPLERLGRWGRRNPLVASLSAAVVLVAALGFAGVFGQMQVAQANERQANENADKADKERDEVRALNEKLRRTLYAAHLNLAQRAWEAGGVARVQELLDLQLPKKGETDLRGFEWHFLHRFCHADIFTFKGHTRDVRSVAYSPDGKRLASTSGDGTVKVWDSQTGQVLFALKEKANYVSVVFSPDGKRLATASARSRAERRISQAPLQGVGGQVKVWDAKTGKELLTLKASDGGGEVVFSPDGKHLARGVGPASGIYGAVKVWDARTGKETLTFEHRPGWDHRIAFSPDGKRLASGPTGLPGSLGIGGSPVGSLGDVKVWDIETGKELLSLNSFATCLAFSPDGKRLALDSGRKEGLKVLDAQTGKELLVYQRQSVPAFSVVFSPDGQRLASGAYDKTVRVWDAQTGKELLSLQGHTRRITSVVFSPDGRRLASASDDNTVKVWDAQIVRGPFTVNEGRGVVAFSPDGKRFVTGSRDKSVKVWDTQTRQEHFTLKGHTAVIESVAFSPDGKLLASLGGGVERGLLVRGEVKLWDARTGKNLFTFKDLARGSSSVVFSPDGKYLASDGGWRNQGGDVKVWDVQAGKEVLSLQGGAGAVAFSPDGKRLVGGFQGIYRQGQRVIEPEVKVWDAQTGKELVTFKGGGDEVVFSPDGKRLAGRSEMGVKVWDAQTGKELLSLKGHTNTVVRVAFSPDGKRLASASGDMTVRVWDAQTGHELLTLKGHTDWLGGVAFSPDGKRLASASEDKLVKLWDVHTGQELLTLQHTDKVIRVVFSPDGHRLASTSWDGTVTIWDATPLPKKP